MAPDVSFLTNQNSDGSRASPKRTPMRYGGSLDNYKSFDVTTIIGREFPELQLSDLMNASNSDELLRDLAITGAGLLVSESIMNLRIFM